MDDTEATVETVFADSFPEGVGEEATLDGAPGDGTGGGLVGKLQGVLALLQLETLLQGNVLAIVMAVIIASVLGMTLCDQQLFANVGLLNM